MQIFELHNLSSVQGEEEIVFGFHLNKNGSIVVDGWKWADNGLFLQPKLAETYVLASCN
jgi:hypothetical protein